MPPESEPSTATVEAHWQAEYNFWHKIISEEVERLRFNDGYEPLCIDLYPILRNSRIKLAGLCRIGRRRFRAVAFEASDVKGNKVLRLQIHVQP